MNWNRIYIWRCAPRILLLYAFVYSSTPILSIQTKQLSKYTFLTHNNLNINHSSQVARPYNEVIMPSEHTHGCSVLYSTLKPNIFDKFEYPNDDKSLLSRLWDNVKLYFNKKISNIRTYSNLSNIRYLPLLRQYLRDKRINRLSLFDFFENSDDNPNHMMIKDMYSRIMSKECPYMELAMTGPSGIINSFLKLAPNMVKNAICLTVSTMIGSFYKYSAETTIITTADRLAALIMNLQVTGYIYCNAEQRHQLSRLYGPPENHKPAQAKSDNRVTGTTSSDHMADVEAGDELLNYVKALPRSYINSMFENMNPSIVEAMRVSTQKTVQLLTDNIVIPNYADFKDQNRQIIQQTGTFAIQLCFWKLALGYCMGHMETKIELNKSLNSH